MQKRILEIRMIIEFGGETENELPDESILERISDGILHEGWLGKAEIGEIEVQSSDGGADSCWIRDPSIRIRPEG